jgi:hypothetical protein
MLTIGCPSCQKQFWVCEQVAGKTVFCPYCGKTSGVPELTAVPAGDAVSPPGPGLPKSASQNRQRQRVRISQTYPSGWTAANLLGVFLLGIAGVSAAMGYIGMDAIFGFNYHAAFGLAAVLGVAAILFIILGSRRT